MSGGKQEGGREGVDDGSSLMTPGQANGGGGWGGCFGADPWPMGVCVCQVVSPTHLRMKVWERGAGATLACGTGACALVVAANLAGKTNSR